MADKHGNNDFLGTSLMESEWISSTPKPFCYETKFNSEFDETLESVYNSALSDFFTNPKKSLSTIGTKGSSNVSDSELSLPTSFTDDERENTDQEENDDCRKDINFAEDEVASSKDVSLNVEKSQSSCENVDKACRKKEKMFSGVIPAFQYCKFEENLSIEQENENSDVCENTSHRLANRQNIEALHEEYAFKKDGSSEKSSNRIFISSPMDLGKFQSIPMPLNVSSSKLQKKVPTNNDTPRPGSFYGKRRRDDKSNQISENYVSDSVTKSAPPSPILAREIDKDFVKNKRNSLSYFYNNFKKIVSTSKKFKASNSYQCKKADDVSKPECLQKIAAKSFKLYESNKMDNDFLIHSNTKLISDNEITCRPFITCVKKGENQGAFESQVSKTDPCFFPYRSISTENVAEGQGDRSTKEILRENSVTMVENGISSFGMSIDNISDLCSVINETKFDTRESDLDIKSNSSSTSKILGSNDDAGNFDSQAATANSRSNQSFGENVYEKTLEKNKLLSKIIPDLQHCESDENSSTVQTKKLFDACKKNQSFDEYDYKNFLAEEKTSSKANPDFQNSKLSKNSFPEEMSENSDASSSISHRFVDKQFVQTLQPECTLKEDGINEGNSDKISVSNPFHSEIFQKSPLSLNTSLKLRRKVLQSKSPNPSPFISSKIILCEDTKKIFQPESLQKESKDSSVELKKNNTSSLFPAANETKFDSKYSDFDIKSNSLLSVKEVSECYPGDIGHSDSQASSLDSRTNPSTSINLIICPFCNNSFSEVSPSKSSVTEITNEDENNKTMKYRPSFNTILDLFNVDNTLSKSILLAILSKNSTEGATYTEIIKYLRKERVSSTKLTKCVKSFLQTAVYANILKIERRRYFVVSRDGAVDNSLISKSARKKISPRKTRQIRQKE